MRGYRNIGNSRSDPRRNFLSAPSLVLHLSYHCYSVSRAEARSYYLTLGLIWSFRLTSWLPVGICVLDCQMSGLHLIQFSSVQSLSRVRLFATPQTAAHQASLSITNSWSLLKLMSIQSVMPSNHLLLCHSLLLPPSIFPSIRVFSSESVLCIRWPKYYVT